MSVEMPSPKSALFRITTDNKYFLSYFEVWFKKHNACKKVWWNMNEKNNWTYIIQFNPEKSYSNFCELLKIAFKNSINPITYSITAEKDFSDKKEFSIYYEKDNSLLSPLKNIFRNKNDHPLINKFYTEMEKSMNEQDLTFQYLSSLIQTIHKIINKSTCNYGISIYLQLDAKYYEKVFNSISMLLKEIISTPFFIFNIEKIKYSLFIDVRYIYNITQSSITPQLNYNPKESYDFHNRVKAFATKYWDLPTGYEYPYKKIAELYEKVFEDFNSKEHKILKIIEKEKEKEENQIDSVKVGVPEAVGTGLE